MNVLRRSFSEGLGWELAYLLVWFAQLLVAGGVVVGGVLLFARALSAGVLP